jgi:hypothetical protein
MPIPSLIAFATLSSLFHLSNNIMLHNTMTINILNLFCLVDGEATSNTFSVKIPPTDTVDDLKNLIKTALSLSLMTLQQKTSFSLKSSTLS